MNTLIRSSALLALSLLAHCKPTPAPTSTSAAPSAAHAVATRGDTHVPAASSASAPVSIFVGQRVDGSQWEARCQANQRCPAVAALPTCAFREAPQSFDAAWSARHSLVGQRVSVRGHLVARGGCTEMGCPDRACCNHCSGQVLLAASNTRGADSQSFALAEGEPRGGPFACSGDDSAMCCGMLADGSAAVATGTLRTSEGRYVIADAVFCAP